MTLKNWRQNAGISLNTDEIQALDEWAAKWQTSRSEAFRRIMREWVELRAMGPAMEQMLALMSETAEGR